MALGSIYGVDYEIMHRRFAAPFKGSAAKGMETPKRFPRD
jgi:hypothetical protein